MKRLSRKKKNGLNISIKSANAFLLTLAIFVITFLMFNGNLYFFKSNNGLENNLSILLNEEEKEFPLVLVDGYYLGRGFLDGEGCYIFQTESNHTLSNLYIIPIENTKIVTNAEFNNLMASIKIYENTIFNKRTHQTETSENTKIDYTIYLTRNDIKDYGVIQQKASNMITFVPFFFYY